MQDSLNRRQITVDEMAPHIHSFSANENKVEKLANWLENWIKLSLKNGKIKPYDYLPSKGDLAFHIGVSLGTMQNVYRLLENEGLVESKQKKGTYIADNNPHKEIIKLTSKCETACEELKKHIKDNNYHIGEAILPTKILSNQFGISDTTMRTAINMLVRDDILAKQNNTYIVKSKNFKVKNIESKTVVQKIAEYIKADFKNNLRKGNKLLSNKLLAKKYNTSMKTIHDALKILHKDGVVQSRRGCYGTYATNSENSQFFYKYEQIESKIKWYIQNNCEIGSKLPSIREFAKMYNVSSKTIKNALDNLAEESFITSVRGKYGGTIVTDIPKTAKEAYTWLAISSEYFRDN